MNTSSNYILDTLFLLAPQFYSTDPLILGQYNSMIALLRCQVNEVILNCNAVMAYAFLLAHYLTLALQPTMGVASNLHEGQLQIGYNVNPEIDFLNLTPYGRAYKDLVKRTVVGSTVTNLPIILGGVQPSFPVGQGCCNGGYGLWGIGNAGW